jgi:hypothetical protein
VSVMTLGNDNRPGQAARPIGDRLTAAGHSCRTSRARSAKVWADHRSRLRHCTRTAGRRRSRRHRHAGCCLAKADRDDSRRPSRCCRTLLTNSVRGLRPPNCDGLVDVGSVIAATQTPVYPPVGFHTWTIGDCIFLLHGQAVSVVAYCRCLVHHIVEQAFKLRRHVTPDGPEALARSKALGSFRGRWRSGRDGSS